VGEDDMSNGNRGNNGNNSDKSSAIPVQKAQVLWNEYEYRHDLVWRVTFQITAAAVILSVAPYVAADALFDYLGLWLLAAPLLAFVLVGFSIGVVNHELFLLDNIRSPYWNLRADLFKEYGLSYAPNESEGSPESTGRTSKRYANLYLGGLAVLSAANIAACGLFWIKGCVLTVLC
jgi:hypothetical protein